MAFEADARCIGVVADAVVHSGGEFKAAGWVNTLRGPGVEVELQTRDPLELQGRYRVSIDVAPTKD